MSAQEIKELVSRLRDGVYGLNRVPLCLEAADAIDAQAAELAEITSQRDTWIVQCHKRDEELAAAADKHTDQAAEIERLRAELAITKQLLDAANAAVKTRSDFKDHPGRG